MRWDILSLKFLNERKIMCKYSRMSLSTSLAIQERAGCFSLLPVRLLSMYPLAMFKISATQPGRRVNSSPLFTEKYLEKLNSSCRFLLHRRNKTFLEMVFFKKPFGFLCAQVTSQRSYVIYQFCSAWKYLWCCFQLVTEIFR